MREYKPDDDCPGCGHKLGHGTHSIDGCLHGWEYNKDGIAVTDGCYCNLRMV